MTPYTIVLFLLLANSRPANVEGIESCILCIIWLFCPRFVPERYVVEVRRLTSTYWGRHRIERYPNEAYLVAVFLHFESTLVEMAPTVLPNLVANMLSVVCEYVLTPFAAVWLGFALQHTVDKMVASAIMRVTQGHIPGFYESARRASGREARKDPSRIFAYLRSEVVPPLSPADLTKEKFETLLFYGLVVFRSLAGCLVVVDVPHTVVVSSTVHGLFAVYQDEC